MKLYISGPMSGKPEHNFPAFRSAAQQLTDAGYDVIDPSENFGGETGRPRAEYMRKDIEHVLHADGIALLAGWSTSKGAQLEVNIARELGLDVMPVEYWVYSNEPVRAREWGTVVNKGGKDYGWGEPAAPAIRQKTILEEAQHLVHGDRGDAYGRPINDFSRTAAIWNALFGQKLAHGQSFGPADVGLGMIGVKLSREVNKHKRDSLTDIAGYAETVQLVHEDLGTG